MTTQPTRPPDASHDTEHACNLTELPLELLGRLLGFVPESWFAASYARLTEPGLTIQLPALAAVCRVFRRALLGSNAIALNFLGLRLPPAEWQAIVAAVGERRTLRPDVLDLDDCNLKPDVLAGLLHAVRPSVVSVRRCHSLHGETLDALPSGGAVSGLLCEGLDCLGGGVPLSRAHWPKLSGVRVLSLVDCRVRLASLLELLPSMPELRCLLLGGAIVEEEIESAQDDSSIAAPAVALGGAGAAGLPLSPPDDDDDAAAPVVEEAFSSKLALVELTWQTDGVRAALRRACPGATQMDLCDGATLPRRLERLTALLGACLAEHGGHAASAALAAALNCRNGRRFTPLHQASVDGAAAAAALLVAHGARADAKDVKGATPLHRAVLDGHEGVAAALLRADDCSLTATNHALETPLYLAALRGHLGCVRLLLRTASNGVEPPSDGGAVGGAVGGGPPAALRSVCYHDGYTPLHAAVIVRAPECCKLLLRYGFAVDATNRFLQTPLHLAACLGSHEAARLLLEHGADALRRDERGKLPWQVARTPALAIELKRAAQEAPDAKKRQREEERKAQSRPHARRGQRQPHFLDSPDGSPHAGSAPVLAAAVATSKSSSLNPNAAVFVPSWA